MPLVSVLMPVYNGALYLKEAIDSILSQTFTDFELIIVDDCSTDDSAGVVCSYKDERIIFLQNTINKRTSYCLNRAIECSRGKYLVRMDQDDISFPERLQIQVDFMGKNPDIGICGTQLQTFGQGIAIEKSSYPLDHTSICLMQLYISPFAHPTVIMRKEVLLKNKLFYAEHIIAEDYDLWARLLPVTQGANLPNVLLHYRRHPKSITHTFYKRIHEERKLIQKNYCMVLFELKNAGMPSMIYSGIPIIRRYGLRLLQKRNEKFSKDLLVKYFTAVDRFFTNNSICRYYLRQVYRKIGLPDNTSSEIQH